MIIGGWMDNGDKLHAAAENDVVHGHPLLSGLVGQPRPRQLQVGPAPEDRVTGGPSSRDHLGLLVDQDPEVLRPFEVDDKLFVPGRRLEAGGSRLRG